MPHEAFILPDWRCAGIMAVSFLQSIGCRQIIFAHPAGNPPSVQILREGIDAGVKITSLEMLKEEHVGKGGDVKSGKIEAFLKSLPPKTGIITTPYQAGVGIAGEMSRINGGSLSEQPIIAVDEEIMSKCAPPLFPVLNFPWEQRVKAAIDYITSPDSTPQKRELVFPMLHSPLVS